MPYKVLLTHDAVNDLEELDTWISTNDSPEKAEYVLDKIGEVFNLDSAVDRSEGILTCWCA